MARFIKFPNVCDRSINSPCATVPATHVLIIYNQAHKNAHESTVSDRDLL